MKIAIFIIVLLAAFVLIPDSWINTLFMSHITIEGDGEEAMNSYSFTFIVVKFVLSLVLAVWPRGDAESENVSPRSGARRGRTTDAQRDKPGLS